MNTPRRIDQLIETISEGQAEAPAILAPEKKAIPYKILSQHLRSTALQLARMGIRPGDRLAVVLPNGPEMASAFIAVSAVCTCAPLNPAYSLHEFKFYLDDLHVKALVTIPGMESYAHAAASELGVPLIHLVPHQELAGIFDLSSDLPINEAVQEPALAGMDDVALVLHTSGTTSRPKIVPLTHRNIFHSAHNIAETYALKSGDRCLNMMPLFHIHGLIGAVAASLISGGSVICAPGFSPSSVLDWLSQLEPTWYTAVPTIHQAVIEQALHRPEVIKSVRLRFMRSCSSPLAPKLAQELEATFSAPVLEAYGMTEATHQIASNPHPPLPHKFGSVGMATGTTRISILDEQGNILKANTMGEICIQGENVVAGYENNPAANKAAFINGWLRTGDRGYLDEDNYLFIQGRFKEIINRGGEKISPREIEEILIQHPAVRQAVVFSTPHVTLGEDVAAAVVLKHNEAVTMQELRHFTALKLADFKVPRLIVFLSDIPKGPTGKIQRVGMGEKLKAELEAVIKSETSGNLEPHTPIEGEILSIWKLVLGEKTIGIHDDFLALGGDSIMAARILVLLQEKFGITLSFRDIFNLPTIETMAKHLQSLQKET